MLNSPLSIPDSIDPYQYWKSSIFCPFFAIFWKQFFYKFEFQTPKTQLIL